MVARKRNPIELLVSGETLGNNMKVGDVVRTGVYVCGEFRPMWLGTVVDISNDEALALVDTGTMHGCARRAHWEQISHLRKEYPNECTCSAKDMPFGQCCKATANAQP